MIPLATVVPLVDPDDKRLAMEIEAQLQQLNYPFIAFVSVYPKPHPVGEAPEMSVFIGTDGSHRDRTATDVVTLALREMHLNCTFEVSARRGRVR